MKRISVALAVSLSACASVAVNYTDLNPPPHAIQPKAPEKVEFFSSATPSRKYVEIGTMTAMHDSITTNTDMFAKMRIEAAKHGCDGVIITQRGTQEAVGACIVYSDQ
jgi:hypothetical protein